MVTVLPKKIETGFNEFQTDLAGGNISSPAVETPKISTPKEQEVLDETTDDTVVVPPVVVPPFSINPPTDVTTSDLDFTQNDVMEERDRLDTEAIAEAEAQRGIVAQTQQEVLDRMQALTGKSARQRQLELEGGVGEDTAEIRRLNTEVADLEAEMTRQLTERTGKGITARSILGEKSRIERRFLAEIGAKTSMIQALQGNIELAQATAERTVDMEFEPIENELAIKLQELEFQEGDLTKAEQKEVAAQKAEIAAQQAEITAQKDLRKEVFKIALDAQKNGADPSMVANILSSQSPEEALVIGSSFVSPMAKLDLALKKQQLLTSELQAKKTLQDIMNYGKLSPSEQRKVDQAQKEALANAKSSIQATQDKINKVEALLSSGGLAPSVGTTVADRTPVTKLGFITKLTTIPLTKTAIKDIKTTITGEQQAFSGGVKQLISGLALDELVEAKARGATFGALSDTELRMLADSATQISNWEIKDENGKGIGIYNIDEASFKKELEFIKEKAQRAMTLSKENIFSEDESSVLDTAYSGTLSAESYYE